MSVLTGELLVDIVTTLATPSHPLVEAKAIIAYCKENDIDLQGSGSPKYAAFRLADLDEGMGQHRLQKFKRGVTPQARNAWSLAADLADARLWAARQGWLLVPWSRAEANWMYRFAGPSATTSPYLGLDD